MINNYDSVVPQNSSGATFFQKQKAASYSFGNRNWFSFVLTFLMLFSFVFVQGQSTANYTFTYGPSILNSMSGSTPVPGIAAYPADSGASTILPIGFNFTYMGTNYSHFNVNTDGQVRLHTSGSGTAMGNSVSGYSASTVTLAPMGGDNETGTGISYLVTGTAPNRKLIIEWNNFYAHWTDPQTSGNMQLVLNEGTGVFEFLYGGIKNSSTASVTRSIFHSSSNTANASAYITVGATPTQNTTATSPTTNSFAASVLIANLANTFYKFTPASTVEAPTALTFSGVTSAGTTINWVDNSTTEYGFLVTRATDAGFTSGVVTSTVASTTAATTGQAYASVQTGLLPSTTYYYKVQALSEAVISADISGSQITNAPGNFVSIVTGNYGTPSTWDINSVPTVYDNIIISAGTTVTVDAVGQAAKNVVVAGTLTYGITPTSFTIDGNLTVNAGGVVNVFNGTTGKTLTVSGNITNNGVIDISVGATTAGNLTLNGTAVQMVSGTGSFNTSVIRNLTFSNTSTAIPNINWGFNNISVDNNLNIANAKINLNSNKLIFGTSATSAGGTFTVTNGGFLNGTFSRWWTTTGGGYNTSGPTSVPAGSPAGRYPFYTSTGEARVFYLGRTTPTVGGKFAVTYNNASTMTSGQNITDGSYVVTDRWDGNFVISTDGTSPVAASYWVTIFAPNAFYTSAIGARIIGQSSAISGTHIATSSLPIGQRSGVSLADLTSGAGLYLGVNSADIPFVSVTNGDWETASTWNKNSVPTASDVVYIANNTTVTVNATAAVSNAMTIYAGGTLNVVGSSLGVTTSVTNNGTLNVSGGAMTTTTTVTNNASSTINISGTGALTVGTTMTNNGTINANAGNLTVTGGSATGISNSSTGTFVVAGGTVRQGPVGGGNTTFSNSGILTVSSGTLNINGSLSHSGSQFNQSGGNINIDGNAAGVTANSASSYHLNMTAVVNWTGGTLTIIDPHASTTSTDVLYYNLATSSNVGTGHTLRFGDGVSTDAGGNAIGFKANTYVGSGRINYGNLVINGGTGTNRIVTGGTYSNVVLGNLTINSSSEYAPAVTVFVAGDFVNNGTFTQTSTLTLSSYVGTTSAVSTNAQTISGSGVFRNLATSPTANLTSLTVNNSNATGVTLNVPLSVSGTLNMTSGIINTTNTNLLTLGTAIAAGTLIGTPSATNMIKGPFQRTIASGNSATNYISFPVGKSTYAPIAIAPVTTAVSVVKAEAFDSNTGTLNPSIVNMTTSKRWEAPIVSGTVTGVNVRLFDSGILATSIPVQAASAAGEYTNSFGSVATAAAGASTESNTPLAFPDYTGFLSYADSNVCSGTPTPGNTVASSTVICLGANVNLSLQNSTNGTGVTYQWKSSTDGITYTAITGATNATLTVTPTASLYYVCDVTCANSASTTTSTAVQVTFSTSVTGTTPGTRCGTGTVVLGATGSTGTTVKWYSAITGGTALGTGITFTTPSIAATTTYYAGAESASPGVVSIGSNSSTSSTSGITPYTSNYEGSRIQYLVTAADLTSYGLTAGAITSLGFKITSSGAGTTPQSGFTIKVAQVSNASISTFLTPTFETVYGPVSEPAPAVGNKIYTFSSPVNWDGTSSLLIEICHDNDPNATCPSCYSGNSTVAVSTTTYNSVYGRYVDNAAACGSATAGSAVSTFTSRPDFIINGQVACQSARVPVVATVTPPPALTLSAASAIICESDNTPVVTVTSTIGDYDSYVWSPALGVSGDQNTGWTFNPAVSTVYTLTATQSSGSLCTTSTIFTVTVNSRPSAMTITPSPAPVCVGSIQALVVNGGTLNNVSILSENFNAPTNTWTTLNNSTGGTPADANWTLRNSGYVYSSYGTFSSNDASQFYLSNSDDQGSGGTTDTALISPSFATTSFTTATISFWHYFRSPGTAKVQYSVDGGNVWFDIQSFTANTGAISGFVQENLVLPSGALNQANVKIRFKYDASWQYFWALDNVTISGTLSNLITWSPTANLYSDAAATVPYTGGAANTVYVKSSLPVSTTYTATSTVAGTGCTTSASVAVTINAAPVLVTNAASVCFGGSVDLTAAAITAGSDAGLTFTYWTDAAATVALATPTAVTASGTYYIKATNAAGCSTVASVGVTVYPLPTVVVANPAAVCSPSTVDITTAAVTSGSDTGLTYTYWTDAAATVALTAPNAVPTSGTYYIKGTNANGCSTIAAVQVTVTVTPAPTGATTQAFCGSASIANLVVTGTDIKWYSAATGGTEYPSAILANIGLVNGTTYYASQTANGCESTTRLAVTVTLNAVPSAPNAVNQDFCTAPVVAQVQPHGSSFNWYTSATGGSPLLSTDVLTPGTYYVSQLSNGCESTRTAVTISVTPIASPTGASTQNIFGAISSDATIEDINVSGAGIVWYATAQDAADGTNPLAAGTELVNGQTYYAVSVVGTCRSAALAVTVTVTLEAAHFDSNALQYYPNPTRDVVHVQYSNAISHVRVINLLGQVVIDRKEQATSIQVDLSGFAAGTYIVEVASQDAIKQFKVVKSE